MSKIIADPEVLDRVKKAKPGDKTVYINMDAIRELPDEYEIVFTDVEFDRADLSKSFSDVGTKEKPMWYPKTETLYAIAEACGISGGQKSYPEAIVEEVDINLMLMKPLEDAPTFRRMIVGRAVTKQSVRLMEDGSLLPSSQCRSDYNAWEYCCTLWANEEKWTDGYTKAGKYENKYDTTYKRRAHFQEEMKFANRKAETKAHCKTIRELASLPTGFASADLVGGKLTFAKVRRSAMVLKAETAARLAAISRGITAPVAAPLLFGPEEPRVAEVEEVIDFPMNEPVPKEKPKLNARDEMLAVLTTYQSDGVIPKNFIDVMGSMIRWLEQWPQAHSDPARASFWKKCVDNLAAIERAIPEAARIVHREF